MVSNIWHAVAYGVPWLYIAALYAWWRFLVTDGAYLAISGFVRERWGDMAAGPILAWAIHMVWFHFCSLLHVFFDNVQGPWSKYKVHR